jgi:predicted outer membrane repeat protein
VRLVSTDGTDAGTCEFFPCATIQYAINQTGFTDIIEVAEGTYTESGITIDRNVHIMGKGADKTIIQATDSPPASNRVFNILPRYKVVIYDVTIRNGYIDGRGGGIYVDQSALKMRNVSVENNTSSGVHGEGGGVYLNEGQLDLKRCTFSNNFASVGGGAIYLHYSSADIENATLSGNEALIKGGGIGTLSDNPKTIDITYSTIYDNDAGVRGGGMQVESNFDAVLSNSIVAGNSAGTDGPDIYGEIHSKDYNLIEDTSNSTITGIVDNNIYGQDAKLGALINNGGSTPTHALLPSSPAIDGAKCLEPYIDQRGQTRPIDKPDIVNVADGCDIGAYEDDFKQNLPIVLK